MRKSCCRWRWFLPLGMLAAVGLATGPIGATEIVLKDGRSLYGKLGKVASLADVPDPIKPDQEKIMSILFLDDNLRRTFFSDRQVREVRQEENRQAEERYQLRQRALRGGSSVKSVGLPVRVQPFDEFGRRVFTMATARGPIDVIQGITVLTPQWFKAEGITHVWDMRMATAALPRDTLEKILWKQINRDDVESYKKAARFYLQCGRPEDARRILEDLITAFPGRTDLKEQLAPSLRAIQQLSAQRILNELRLRRDAGQHQLVVRLLKEFPTENVGGEVLQGGREILEHYQTMETRRTEIVRRLKSLIARIPDVAEREKLGPIFDEIAAELGPNTLDRMAAFYQNVDDPKMPEAQKVALAVSGWLMGADAATDQLSVAISACKVRKMICDYLTESSKSGKRGDHKLAAGLIQEEVGGKPAMVAAILAHMKPPLPMPDATDGQPGEFVLETPGLDADSTVKYRIQLPPEYDPCRCYPTIVTLHGAASSGKDQIDWWAGWRNKKGARMGQATRQGYIVLAPEWTEADPKQYGYTAREHAAVLNALRDACRRFSIDTDRVFLSGHGIGGDAAWDIGLAHPDLWAGVIVVSGSTDRYCARYWENARYVPFYVVVGELDGAKLTKNALDLDRYLRRGFNATVVEYQGRGLDDYYDEILRLFEWMGRFRRDFYPREFACQTMRPWDNYFWWLEVSHLPPRATVDPADWPPPRGTQPTQVKGTITKNNGINVQTGAGHVVVWLSPKMVDFSQKVAVSVNARRVNGPEMTVRPDPYVMLEDVRTRGDRQHPFWARVEATTGRVRSSD
ncbi:MAG: PHB depolymerase family esterase [Thermoguttaceae bacterium]